MAGLVCHGCGNAIEGRYVTALGANWHPDHFQCGACGRPMNGAGFYERGGRPYHEHCYDERFLPRCAIGGEPMNEWLESVWGERFCRKHGATYPRCRFCGRLAPGTATADARCPRCDATAVWNEVGANARFTSLLDWVRGHGMTVPAGTTLRLELVDASALVESGRDGKGQRVLGRAYRTTTTLNGQIVAIRSDRVVVERGLPSPLFEGVAVHELGHAWLAVHQVSGLPEWAEEGFCELLSHRWYLDQGAAEALYHARRIAENPDRVYGDGFRRLNDLAQSHGLDGIIASLWTAKTLPGRPLMAGFNLRRWHDPSPVIEEDAHR